MLDAAEPGTKPRDVKPSDVKPSGVKPHDAGNGLVCATFAANGDWLSLGAAHPVHGFVELNRLPPFEPSWRGDPSAVRRYRARMVEDRYAFLRLENAETAEVEVWPSTTDSLITVRYRISRPDRDSTPVAIHYRGLLDRHAYAEITDISPLQPLQTTNRLFIAGNELRVESTLPATATITVQVADGQRVAWSRDGGGGARMLVDWADADHLVIVVTCSLRTRDSPVPGRPVREEGQRKGFEAVAAAGQLRTPATVLPRLSDIVNGTTAYILGCTALPVEDREVCIVTDHRLLPLSWTRDAYYQALLLLCLAAHEPRAVPTVADHLRWLWYRSRDSRGSWMRSHLTNGQVKDHGLQADQQLYPILELCDYRRVTGAWPDPEIGPSSELPGATAWRTMVAEAWTQLPRDQRTGLLSSQENPADDPSGLPYTLSTQILYWYTAARLHEYQAELDLGSLNLGATAQRVKAAVDRHFTVAGPFGTQWAYESDLRGQRRLYNDANDLPTAFAPLWGFCAATTPQWVATMRFTFSEHNPAYRTGDYGGLGSMHTPGTWPLGDIQSWVAASLLGDDHAADAAISRLTTIAAADGLLPEAYEPDTGAWRARHWFAWPSAALGALYISSIDTDAPWTLDELRRDAAGSVRWPGPAGYAR